MTSIRSSSEAADCVMAAIVRNVPFSKGVKSPAKVRKALHTVQTSVNSDLVVTAVEDKNSGPLGKVKCEKTQGNTLSGGIESMGKENAILRSKSESCVSSHAISKPQPKNQGKISKHSKKSGRKAKTPKDSSNQSRASTKSAEKNAPEVTPGYEFLTAGPSEQDAISQEELDWKDLAEQYQLSLEFALWENEKLHNELTILKKENDLLMSAIEDGCRLADLVEECQGNVQ